MTERIVQPDLSEQHACVITEKMRSAVLVEAFRVRRGRVSGCSADARPGGDETGECCRDAGLAGAGRPPFFRYLTVSQPLQMAFFSELIWPNAGFLKAGDEQ